MNFIKKNKFIIFIFVSLFSVSFFTNLHSASAYINQSEPACGPLPPTTLTCGTETNNCNPNGYQYEVYPLEYSNVDGYSAYPFYFQDSGGTCYMGAWFSKSQQYYNGVALTTGVCNVNPDGTYYQQCAYDQYTSCNDYTDLSWLGTSYVEDYSKGYQEEHSGVGAQVFQQVACSADGGSTPYCGDGSCNNGETNATCPADCAAPIPGDFYLSIRGSNITVNAGSSADYLVEVGALSGMSGVVDTACSILTLPTGANCSTVPSVDLSATSPQDIVLHITTQSSTPNGSYSIGGIKGVWNGITHKDLSAILTVQNSIPAPTADLKASVPASAGFTGYTNNDGPLVVYSGAPITLSWSCGNATSATIDGVAVSPVASGSGSYPGGGSGWNHTYTLVCTNGGVSTPDTVSAAVPPAPTNVTASCPSPGTNISLSWTPPSGFTDFYVRIQDTTNGTYLGWNEDFVGTNYNFSGGTPGDSYTAWVHSRASNGAYSDAAYSPGFTCSAPASASSDIKADNTEDSITIPYNTGATLSWSYFNASSCTITAPGSAGTYPSDSGSVGTGNLTSSRTYTISCLPSGSGSNDSVIVNVALPTSYAINVIKGGQGIVISSPAGISCGITCSTQSASFDRDSTVTLTETAPAGKIFTGWGGDCSGKATTCSLVISGDKTVIANFAIDPTFKEF